MTRSTAAAKDEAKRRLGVGFLTVPRYSMIAFANAIEPLRMANRLSGKELCRWTVMSLDGKPTRASNGLSIAPTIAAADAGALDIVVVCGGVDVQAACTGPLLAYLRRCSRRGGGLGALCTGSYALAKAGLLDGHRCAIHWENLAVVSEEFPRVAFTPDLYAIDRNRYTASGGTAPLDLMLTLIRQFLGDERLAYDISEEFIHERIRDQRDKQRIPLLNRVGPRQTKLLQAAELMDKTIEDPLGIDAIARQVGLSRRQLERLFRTHVDERPARYYLRLRLKRARQILLQSRVSVTGAMVQTGFRSAAHFSKCYRREFGLPPSADRQIAGGFPGTAANLRSLPHRASGSG